MLRGLLGGLKKSLSGLGETIFPMAVVIEVLVVEIL